MNRRRTLSAEGINTKRKLIVWDLVQMSGDWSTKEMTGSREGQAGTRSLRGDLVKSSDLLEVQWAERHRTVLLRE